MRQLARADLSPGLPYTSNPANTYYMLDLVLDGAGAVVSACASRAEGAGGIFQNIALLGANLVLDALLHFFPGRLRRPGGTALARRLFRPMRFEAAPAQAIAQLAARGRYEHN